MQKKTLLLLALVFSLSWLFRDAYVQNLVIDNPIRNDAKQYVLYGYNLAERQVYSAALPSKEPVPDSVRSPGYPLLIAGCFLIGGKKFYPLLLNIQCLLGAVTAVLTFLLARKFLPCFWAAGGAVLVGISPHLVAMAGYVLTETLFGFLLLSGLLGFALAVEKGGAARYTGAGTVLGMAYLTNETALFLPFFLVAAAQLSGQNQKETGRKHFGMWALFLIVFLLFPAGWHIRNTLTLPPDALTGKQRAVSTATHGAYPGFIHKDPRFRYYAYREDPMQPEFSSSWKSFFEILLPRIQERPFRYLSWYVFEKPWYLWSWNILQGQGDVFVYPVRSSLFHASNISESLRILMKFLHPFIVLSAFAGTIWIFLVPKQAGHHRCEPVLIFSVLIYYTLMYMIFAPWPRYAVPLRPELYLGALWTLHHVKRVKQW